MITYRDYLEKMIMESTETDDVKGVLVAAMEDAEDIYELDAVEAFLEESKSKDDELTLKEQQDLSGASTAKGDGTNDKKKINLDTYIGNINEDDYKDAMEKFEKGIEQIEDGDIEEGCDTCTDAINEALKVYFGVGGEAKAAIEKDSEVKKDVEELKKDVAELKKQSKSGEATASEIKSLAGKLKVKVKLIGVKVKKILSKFKKPKATTESALEAIFEGASDGVISDDDLEFLVDAVTGSSEE